MAAAHGTRPAPSFSFPESFIPIVPPVIRNPRPPPSTSAPASGRLSPKQARALTLLAGLLIAGGIFVLAVLDRMPLPLRIVVGLSDLFAGLGLLVLVRQKR